MIPMRAVLVAVVALLAAPAPADEMTKAQEDAIVRAFGVTMQARELFASGRFAEAEALFRQSLAINAGFPDNELVVAADLHNIAASLAEQGHLAEAEAIARQALRLRLDHGAVDNALMGSRRLLASILADLGRFAAARAEQEQAVSLTLNGADVVQTDLLRDIIALGWLTASAGDAGGGIAILNQLVPMAGQMPQPDVARLLNALGRLSSMAGEPDQAEAFYRQAVGLSATLPISAGWSARDAASVLGNLGSILNGQGRYPEALVLFRQADAILTGAGFGGDARATILEGLGESLRGMGDPAAAWPVQRAALDIRRASLPEGHVKTGIGFSNLGLTLLAAGQVDPAVASLEQAVAIQRRNGDRLRLANAAVNLSAALAASSRGPEALAMAQEAQAALAEVLPEDHPNRIRAAFNLAWLHLAAGDYIEAAGLADAALARFAANAWRLGGAEADGAGEYRDLRRQVLAAVVAIYETDRDTGMDRAFQAAQWAQASKAAHVARRVAARFATGDDAIAVQVRAHQDLIDRWQALDRQYLALLGSAPAGDPLLTGLGDMIALSEAAVRDSAADLATTFPDYAALTRPNVVTVAEVRAALRPGEALLMPVTTPDETYLFAIAAGSAGWARSDLTEAALDQAVRDLRATLDPTGPARGAAPLVSSFAKPKQAPFAAAAAHRLYLDLIAPVADVLDGSDTLVLVKEGALSGLPLAVLLRDAVDLDGADATGFAAAPWLIRDFALATTVSAPGFVAGRADRSRRVADVVLAGFADPDFTGAENAAAPPLAQLFTRASADIAGVRGLARLPGTRRELTGLAQALGVPPEQMRFGADATEAAVKSSDSLRRARIAVFATHGLLAGDLSGLAEPALAFSPPATPGEDDDGLLTASEAAQLDLAADWVILSACNTAGADGSPGGAGLSGLASGFLYAGARALLVSHWPVRDDAAERLTRATIEGQAVDPATGKARHLQAAMLALMQNGDIPGHAHPSTWAPFVVVGAD
jgi:CHAT domain-containing protein